MNLLKLVRIPKILLVVFLSQFLVFICKTWGNDVVNDFHSWGSTFGWFVNSFFELGNHLWNTMYEEKMF